LGIYCAPQRSDNSGQGIAQKVASTQANTSATAAATITHD
jgi:hypothetical protein